MITKETCVKIWSCWNEIDKANELLSNLAKATKEDEEKAPPTIHNAFGENVGLQLGVPSGRDSHYLYGVPIELGVKIIERHIEEKNRRLEELMAFAKIEL